jgi:hypothetical protein
MGFLDKANRGIEHLKFPQTRATTKASTTKANSEKQLSCPVLSTSVFG